jgi:hypothetical protein
MAFSEKDKWEVRFGFIGAVFGGLSIIVSVFIYLHGNDAALRKEHDLIAAQRNIDYERQLWNEMRATYKELAQTLGRMAAELDAAGSFSNAARRDFNAAYWGALILVEDEAVQFEMVKLRNDLRDLEHSRISQDKIKLRIERIVTLSKEHILRDADIAAN